MLTEDYKSSASKNVQLQYKCKYTRLKCIQACADRLANSIHHDSPNVKWMQLPWPNRLQEVYNSKWRLQQNPVSTWTETSSEATKCMKTNRLHENIIGEDYKVMSGNIQQWSYHNETMIKWTHVHRFRNQGPSMFRQYACETILHECTEATS